MEMQMQIKRKPEDELIEHWVMEDVEFDFDVIDPDEDQVEFLEEEK